MPLTMRVGLSKQISLPNGSLGASCNIEVEVDVASLRDVDDFDHTIQEAYSVCRDAVDGELHQHGAAVNTNSTPSPRNGFACRCRPDLREVDLMDHGQGRQEHRPF